MQQDPPEGPVATVRRRPRNLARRRSRSEDEGCASSSGSDVEQSPSKTSAAASVGSAAHDDAAQQHRTGDPFSRQRSASENDTGPYARQRSASENDLPPASEFIRGDGRPQLCISPGKDESQGRSSQPPGWIWKQRSWAADSPEDDDDFWNSDDPAPERQVSQELVLPAEKRELALDHVAFLADQLRLQIAEKKERRKKRAMKKYSSWAGGLQSADVADVSGCSPTDSLDLRSRQKSEDPEKIPAQLQQIFPVIDTSLGTAQTHEDILMFDWDDTLFPTCHVTEAIWPCLPEDKRFEELPKSSSFYEQLALHGELLRDFLCSARKVATVVIVTLCLRPWVEQSAQWYLPELDITSLFEQLGIRIYYAREYVTRRETLAASVEEGVDLFTIAKRNAMRACLKDLRRKSGLRPNVISIGDSTAEIHGIKEVIWARDADDDLVKTVKFIPQPAIQPLKFQLQLLQSWLSALIAHDQDENLDMQDSATSSQVVQQIISSHPSWTVDGSVSPSRSYGGCSPTLSPCKSPS